MWRMIVIDDENPTLALHKILLEKFGPFQVVGIFQSALDAFKNLPKYKYDAILIDVEMPKISGLEFAQNLVNDGIDVPIIFSTAYPNYAVEAFRVQALDYILKPMTPHHVKELNIRLQKYYGLFQKQIATNKLIVQLYGDSVVKVGKQVIKWPTRVTEELFYYFVLNNGRFISKWRIIDDIWSNLEDKRALSNLYNTIYRLRQLFVQLEVPVTIERVNDGYEMRFDNTLEVLNRKDASELLLESKGYLWAYRFSN
ncbi:TPA: response regulator [Bacillus cereus]|nr:response regulator [Bacillus cereus]